jgi:hypothetical protein
MFLSIDQICLESIAVEKRDWVFCTGEIEDHALSPEVKMVMSVSKLEQKDGYIPIQKHIQEAGSFANDFETKTGTDNAMPIRCKFLVHGILNNLCLPMHSKMTSSVFKWY